MDKLHHGIGRIGIVLNLVDSQKRHVTRCINHLIDEHNSSFVQSNKSAVTVLRGVVETFELIENALKGDK